MRKLLAVFAIALAGSAALLASPAQVAIVAAFDRESEDGFLIGLRDELDRLFAATGVRFRWYAANGSIAMGAVDSVVAVYFTNAAHTTSVLARTARTDTEIQPFIYVNLDLIARYASMGSGATLGRAAGRVLAHELYHLFTQTSAHDHSPLFSHAISRAVLAAPAVSFTAAELMELNAACAEKRWAPRPSSTV